MVAMFFSSTVTVMVSSGVRRTMSEKILALSTDRPASAVWEGMVVVMPSSRS